MPILHKPRPNPDTGLGMHDTNQAGNHHPAGADEHARRLRAAGVTWYKVLASGDNKLELAEALARHGIMPVVRLWSHRPVPNWTPDPAHLRRYVEAARRGGMPTCYIQTLNEPNLLDEIAAGYDPGAELAHLTARQWAHHAEMILGEGGIPCTPPPTPGGHYNHRLWTIEFGGELERLGKLDLVRQGAVGIHPRPHNNPPDAPRDTGNPPNDVTWNEHTWYIQHWTDRLGGDTPVFIALEHGYSPNDRQNAEYPPMNDLLWAEYNAELFRRMNPNHEQAIHPAIYGLCYWLQINEGGPWLHDGAFGTGRWIGDGPSDDDASWGRYLWAIQPNWDRNDQPDPGPSPDPDPAPEPVPTGTTSPEPEWDVPQWVMDQLHWQPVKDLQDGEQYIRIERVRFVPESASGGRHHIYAMEPHDPSWIMNVWWDGGPGAVPVPLDKPASEPAANFAMYGEGYSVSFANGGGLRSDSVGGLGIYGNHHVSFEIWATVATATVEPDPDPDPTPAPDPGALAGWMLGWTKANQIMSLNPSSSLEVAAAADGFYPVTNEGRITEGGVKYAIRGFEMPGTDPVRHRAYYAPESNYNDVGWFERE